VRVRLNYEPRQAFVPFHMRRERWAALVCHRRAGKTVACVADLVDAALRCEKPNPRFAYVAPYFTQAKDVAWVYVKQMVTPIPGATINESELRADLPNGGRIRLYGADNADRLRGLFLDGIVMDEFADMRPSVWSEVIRPALSDRQGWAVFIGTPKGRNQFWDIYRYAEQANDWFAMSLRADDSGLLPAEELEDAKRMMTPEQYAQEYLCSFEAAIIGAYYGKEIAEAERAGRIVESLYDPALPVYTAWDLGIGDSTAIWFFQVYANELRVIDAYENHGQALSHYVAVLESKPYKYGADYVPHDARVRELGTGRTRIETLQGLGRKPELVPDHKVMDGINALRLSFGSIWFDRQCAEGLEALRQYRADFDEKTRAFKDRPRHDWTSHYADAARYMAMAWREMRPQPRAPAGPRRLNVGIMGGATFNDVAPFPRQRNEDTRI
jgi:hypothetical protein